MQPLSRILSPQPIIFINFDVRPNSKCDCGRGPGPYEADEITEGQLRITDHTEPISDASFSPDGTALATASLDGQVKFFQVNIPSPLLSSSILL